MADYPRPRRVMTRAGIEKLEVPYVPELSPVSERPAHLMTRPWLDWCRQVTGFIQHSESGGGATGDVVGPSGATADAIAIYSGTTGKLIKDSLKTIANVISDAVNAAIAAILPGGKLPAVNLPVHHVMHEPGGTDAITTLDGAVIQTGTIADARLSSNVVLESIGNTFTGNPQAIHGAPPRLHLLETNAPVDNRQFQLTAFEQGFQIDSINDANTSGQNLVRVDRLGAMTVGAVAPVVGGNVARRDTANTFTADQTIQANSPRLLLIDTSQPADQRLFRITNNAQGLRVLATNDAITVNQSIPLVLDRLGNAIIGQDISEKGRAAPVGHWINVPFNAGNFTGYASMTWTVEAGDVLSNSYMLVGKSLFWNLRLNGTSVGGTSALFLLVTMPPGLSIARVSPLPCALAVDVGVAVDAFPVHVDGTHFGFQKVAGTNWGASTNTTLVYVTVLVELL